MFGYIKTRTDELKIRDYADYRGVYCSLCRTLGKRYGITARFLLNYDFTFLAVFLLAFSDKPQFCDGRCRFNPLKKCRYTGKNEVLDLCADLTVISAYHKLLDDISDKVFKKRLRARLLIPFIRLKYKKALRLAPGYCNIVEDAMQKQRAAEENKALPDDAADPSASALGHFVSNQRDDKFMAAYHIGRFVYLCDAFDDLADDLKSGDFNPFIIKYKIKTPSDIKKNQTNIVGDLNLTIAELSDKIFSLDFKCFENILYNVVSLGLSGVCENIKKKEDKDESL